MASSVMVSRQLSSLTPLPPTPCGACASPESSAKRISYKFPGRAFAAHRDSGSESSDGCLGEKSGKTRANTFLLRLGLAATSVGSLASDIPVNAAEASSGLLAVADGGSFSSLTLALAGGGAIAAIAAAVTLNDPEKRRQQQAAEVGGNEKEVVRSYFNTTGFDRWRKIYGETDEVNSVQLDIRVGHAQTVEKVLSWLREDKLEGMTVCDAGCGTGSLSIPLALEGARVSASDISSAMVEEASRRAAAAIKDAGGRGQQPLFEAKDLESLSGSYDTVACLDVFIHYPQEEAAKMVRHLASLANKKLIVSFAPKTPWYSVLKRVGELFPGPSKATRAYLHDEQEIEAALNAAGWRVTRKEMTATKFYFSRLFEAVPK